VYLEKLIELKKKLDFVEAVKRRKNEV